jgi:phage baseplate assembly protein W
MTMSNDNTHYKLPLDISRFFSEKGGYLERCTELESIDQHLGLLLATHRGEHGFDQRYGTKLWEMDFVNIVSRPAWEEEFITYIRQGIKLHEKRIKDVVIRLDIRDMVRENFALNGYNVRKRVDVSIHGTVISTNKRHTFRHFIYLGPLSRD